MSGRLSREYHLRAGKIFGFIADLLTVASWIGITLSGVMGFFHHSWKWAIPIILLVLVWFSIILARKHARDILHFIFGLFALNLPYRFLSRTAEYEYVSLDRMKFKTLYEVKSLQTGVDYIRARFNWSGETDKNKIRLTPVQDGDNKIYTARLVPDGSEYGYTYYKVFSSSKHNRGDAPFLVGTLSDLRVSDRPVSHHLLASISATTDILHMRVIFPDFLVPQNIEFFEYLHATDEHHWHRSEGVAKRQGKKWVVQWDVDRPIYGGKYLIRWSFE